MTKGKCQVTVIFKNLIYNPYCSVIFQSKGDYKTDELESICKRAFQTFIEEKNYNSHSYIQLDIRNEDGKLNGGKMARYIQEAYFTRLNPLSYLHDRTMISNQEKENIIRNQFINNDKQSILILEPQKMNMVEEKERILEKAKKYSTVILENKFDQQELALSKYKATIVPIKLLSNFSLSSYHKNYTNGVGYWKMLCESRKKVPEVIENIIAIRTHLLKRANRTVSIYATESDLAYCQKYFGRESRTECKERYYFGKVMENSFIALESYENYVAMGFPLLSQELGRWQKNKIICKMLTEEYLLPIVRDRNSAYSCEINMLENSCILFSVKDPDIESTIQTFYEMESYVYNYQKKLIQRVPQYEARIASRFRTEIKTPSNDLATFQMLCPSFGKEKAKRWYPQDWTITESDMSYFADMLKDGITNAAFCVMGSESELEQLSIEFQEKITL